MSEVRITNKFGEFNAIVKEGLALGITAGAITLQATMKQNFGTGNELTAGRVNAIQIRRARRDSSTGRLTRTRGGKVRQFKTRRNLYRAAAPGEYPGIRTGALRRSIFATKATSDYLSSTIGTSLKHGRWLEYGTFNKDGSVRMRARPWALRSFRTTRADMLRRTADVAGKYIRGKARGLVGSRP